MKKKALKFLSLLNNSTFLTFIVIIMVVVIPTSIIAKLIFDMQLQNQTYVKTFGAKAYWSDNFDNPVSVIDWQYNSTAIGNLENGTWYNCTFYIYNTGQGNINVSSVSLVNFTPINHNVTFNYDWILNDSYVASKTFSHFTLMIQPIFDESATEELISFSVIVQIEEV